MSREFIIPQICQTGNSDSDFTFDNAAHKAFSQLRLRSLIHENSNVFKLFDFSGLFGVTLRHSSIGFNEPELRVIRWVILTYSTLVSLSTCYVSKFLTVHVKGYVLGHKREVWWKQWQQFICDKMAPGALKFIIFCKLSPLCKNIFVFLVDLWWWPCFALSWPWVIPLYMTWLILLWLFLWLCHRYPLLIVLTFLTFFLESYWMLSLLFDNFLYTIFRKTTGTLNDTSH